MENLRKIIRQMLFEFKQPMIIDSEIENTSHGGEVGKISGVVQYDVQFLQNWMNNEKIDESIQNYILSKTSMPVAILKNINIYENYRHMGYGKYGMEQFLDETYKANFVLLIADTGESNDFQLEEWYKTFGFETIGQVGGMPIMLLKRD